MASSSDPREVLRAATGFPGRIFRAYLAEDYDGKSQFVLVKLTWGGVSSGYKVMVAAGDHSGHEPMPEGSLVTVTSVHGVMEALLGQRGRPLSGCCPDDMLKPHEADGTFPDVFEGEVHDTAWGMFVPPIYQNPPSPRGYTYANPLPVPLQPYDYHFLFNASPSGFNPTSFIGTGAVNTGTAFGLSPSVMLDWDTTEAEWRWDLGRPVSLCQGIFACDGSISNGQPVYDGHPFNYTPDVSQWSTHRIRISASDDGSSFKRIVDWDQIQILPQSFGSWAWFCIDQQDSEHQYWALNVEDKLGTGGFDGFHSYGGWRFVNFSLWERNV